MSAVDVAAYIEGMVSLDEGGAMKIQKLTYYAQAWSLAWRGIPLFDDEVQAWRDGPVVPNLYRENKYKRVNGKLAAASRDLSDVQKAVVEAVVDFYGDFSAQELSDRTHKEEPWQRARRGLKQEERGREVITVKEMRNFYMKQALMEERRSVPSAPSETLSSADVAKVEEVGRQQAKKWAATLEWLKDK
ncbi:Panacea domain-containing protein [Corynebacterium lowii]|uniref:Panacea domain-containing protein n=1 Tax=Corynebacterium lowii TaxID=1544413 RepID=UPI001B7FF11E|nr:type II toxin-antitoxin system antitoxin SocA domain-containing protein [Corynebacterium lowii]MDP9851948.1 putative phage-associated protein [Corynebacterium lowii]